MELALVIMQLRLICLPHRVILQDVSITARHGHHEVYDFWRTLAPVAAVPTSASVITHSGSSLDVGDTEPSSKDKYNAAKFTWSHTSSGEISVGLLHSLHIFNIDAARFNAKGYFACAEPWIFQDYCLIMHSF